MYYELKNKENKDEKDKNRLSIAMDKIEWLKQKESKNQWQAFNFSDYNQNKELKDVKITQKDRDELYQQVETRYDD